MIFTPGLRASTGSLRQLLLSRVRPSGSQYLRLSEKQLSTSAPLLKASPQAWQRPSFLQQNSLRNFSNSASKYEANPMYANYRKYQRAKNWEHLMYSTSLLIVVLGLSYAAVPLYRMFCATTGFGGTPNINHTFEPENLVPVTNSRRLKITFSSNVSNLLEWTFKPQQREVNVLPGETALAFYVAQNKADHDIIGISTYNVTPIKVGQYFNKIQCFCFEEQKLAAGEEVDMPVFFFIDPEFAEDPWMDDVDTITLSYTFFNARPNPAALPENK
ncbi:Cytochrome c oxidase assembly protein cox11, mitochondrial [Basidiobolus ranarum]|uniref:Cytochrome c oxidase assembly protein cox11, mitochondrial n=1 Tax=Basidiobolus ranarum TaxID=34480 RepID=A0ABR2X102_9FUNG